jgi:iron complex transport system permease protein
VAAAVAVSGVIGFVGLVAPHLVRLLTGPDHRWVLPLSAVMGALLVVASDIFARLLIAPAELPIGLMMASIGGPFFLWLLLQQRARVGF